MAARRISSGGALLSQNTYDEDEVMSSNINIQFLILIFSLPSRKLEDEQVHKTISVRRSLGGVRRSFGAPRRSLGEAGAPNLP